MNPRGGYVATLECSRQRGARVLLNQIVNGTTDKWQQHLACLRGQKATVAHHFNGDIDQRREIRRRHQRRRMIERLALRIYHKTVTAEIAHELFADANGFGVAFQREVDTRKGPWRMECAAD